MLVTLIRIFSQKQLVGEADIGVCWEGNVSFSWDKGLQPRALSVFIRELLVDLSMGLAVDALAGELPICLSLICVVMRL